MSEFFFYARYIIVITLLGLALAWTITLWPTDEFTSQQRIRANDNHFMAPP
jgi:hypothetical protein